MSLVCISVAAQSEKVIDSLRTHLQSALTHQEIWDVQLSLNEAWAESNQDSALFYGRKVYKHSALLKDSLYIIKGCRAIGYAFDYAYQSDSAKKYYLQGLEIAQRIQDSLQIGNSYFNLGTLLLLSGRYSQALPYYEEALAIYTREPQNKVGLSKVYNNLGIIYRRVKQYDQAIEIYNKALSLNYAQLNEEQTANLYTNLANAYSAQKKYDSAEVYFTKTIDYAKKFKDALFHYYATNGLGILNFEKKNYKKAKGFFLNAAQDRELVEANLKITAYGYLGEIESIAEAYKEANDYFSKAILFVDESNLIDQSMGLYLQLSDHYERMGDFNKSLVYHKKYTELNSQILSSEVINRTTEWKERYQTQEKEQEIIVLTLANRQAVALAQEKESERNLFVFSSLLLGLLFLVSIFLYQTRKKAARLLQAKNELINQSLEENKLLLKEIHHRVKNNLQVITSLLNMQSHFNADSKVTEAVLESRNRVYAMSLIHQSLYQQDTATEINIHEYLQQLLDNLEIGYELESTTISLVLDAESLRIDADQAIPLGLIVNELVTNAYKHAFDDRKEGIINVRFRQSGNNYMLVVRDDGVGNQGRPFETKKSLGTVLIHDLTRKLKGEISISTENGVTTELIFPIKTRG